MSFVYIFIKGEKHLILGKNSSIFYNLVVKKKTSRPLFSIIAYDSKYSMCGLLCLLLGYDEVVFWYGFRSRREGLIGRRRRAPSSLW